MLSSPSPSGFRDAPPIEACVSPLYNPPGTHILLAAALAYAEQQRALATETGGAESATSTTASTSISISTSPLSVPDDLPWEDRDSEPEREQERVEGRDSDIAPPPDPTTARKATHACPTCKKRFNRPSSLRTHLNTHTGALPFVCPLPGCGQAFNVNSNMRRHFRTHRGMEGVAIPSVVESGSGSSEAKRATRGRRRKSIPIETQTVLLDSARTTNPSPSYTPATSLPTSAPQPQLHTTSGTAQQAIEDDGGSESDFMQSYIFANPDPKVSMAMASDAHFASPPTPMNNNTWLRDGYGTGWQMQYATGSDSGFSSGWPASNRTATSAVRGTWM